MDGSEKNLAITYLAFVQAIAVINDKHSVPQTVFEILYICVVQKSSLVHDIYLMHCMIAEDSDSNICSSVAAWARTQFSLKHMLRPVIYQFWCRMRVRWCWWVRQCLPHVALKYMVIYIQRLKKWEAKARSFGQIQRMWVTSVGNIRFSGKWSRIKWFTKTSWKIKTWLNSFLKSFVSFSILLRIMCFVL